MITVQACAVEPLQPDARFCAEYPGNMKAVQQRRQARC
jgi:hypothetical protein